MKQHLVTVIYPGTFTMTFRETFHTDDVKEILEVVFGNWNGGSGDESEHFRRSHVRSLSVGDFVKVDDTIYQYLSFGWNEVSQERVDEFTKKVEDHPDFKIHGGWVAMSEVMWSEKRATLDKELETV